MWDSVFNNGKLFDLLCQYSTKLQNSKVILFEENNSKYTMLIRKGRYLIYYKHFQSVADFMHEI